MMGKRRRDRSNEIVVVSAAMTAGLLAVVLPMLCMWRRK